MTDTISNFKGYAIIGGGDQVRASVVKAYVVMHSPVASVSHVKAYAILEPPPDSLFVVDGDQLKVNADLAAEVGQHTIQVRVTDANLNQFTKSIDIDIT